MRAVWLATMSAVAALPAAAEIHEYMIRRLIYLHTTCGAQQIEALASSHDGRQRFQIFCANIATYPDGILVECADLVDDRSCKIATPAQSFDSLELLQR